MSEFDKTLRAHFVRYPEMEPQDAVKLAYQSEFGGGHLISDEGESLERLRAEYRLAEPQPGAALTEEIGNGLCRIQLQAVDERQVPLSVLNRLFVLGSAQTRGSIEGFQKRLRQLTNAAERGDAPFSAVQLGAYLETYERAGYPMVGHSERYRAHYTPAYRVVPAHLAVFWPLYKELHRLMAEKRSVTIGIDGMSASGKTTLSALLTEVFSCAVIHMDDFFLPTHLRTPERLSQPGGNVHYERFAAQVAPFIGRQTEFSYAPFDCHTMDFAPPVNVKRKGLTVIEGAYSLHPKLGIPYDLRVFLAIDRDEQVRRILARNGPELCQRFRQVWIPMEQTYFDAFEIPQSCDLIFQTCEAAEGM